MGYKLPYNSLPNLGTLEPGDIIPILRPPFQEGSASFLDIHNFVSPYKIYTALISQSDFNDPIVIILENTIGDINWSFDANGSYFGTLTGAFTEYKSFSIITTNTNSSDAVVFSTQFISVDTICINTYNITTSSYQNGLLLNTPIEIRVYNSESA